MKDACRLVVGGIVLFGLGLSFYSAVIDTDREFPFSLVRHLSFLTIITNWLIVFAMFFPVLAKETQIGQFFDRPGVRTAILDYIIIVAVGFHLLLAHLYTYQGVDIISDFIVHTAAPILVALEWLFFTRKGSLSFRQVPFWLLAPLAYMLYCILRGELTGNYPYSLINADERGHAAAVMIYGQFTIGYFLVGCLLVAIAKLPFLPKD